MDARWGLETGVLKLEITQSCGDLMKINSNKQATRNVFCHKATWKKFYHLQDILMCLCSFILLSYRTASWKVMWSSVSIMLPFKIVQLEELRFKQLPVISLAAQLTGIASWMSNSFLCELLWLKMILSACPCFWFLHVIVWQSTILFGWSMIHYRTCSLTNSLASVCKVSICNIFCQKVLNFITVDDVIGSWINKTFRDWFSTLASFSSRGVKVNSFTVARHVPLQRRGCILVVSIPKHKDCLYFCYFAGNMQNFPWTFMPFIPREHNNYQILENMHFLRKHSCRIFPF